MKILYVLLLSSDKELNLNPAMLSCLSADYVSAYLCKNATTNKQILACDKGDLQTERKWYQFYSLLFNSFIN